MGRERAMDTSLDEICRRVAARAGAAAEPSVPPVAEDLHGALGGHPPERILRVVKAGPIEAVVLSVPPGFRQRGTAPARPHEAAELISRSVAMICGLALPRRTWGRVALVRFEEGWPDALEVAAVMECNPTQVMKFGILPGQDVEAALDRVPAFANFWRVRSPASPTWLEALSAPGRLGPLAEVDLHLEPRPGLTVLSGGQNTGKSLLLVTAMMAASGEDGGLEATFSDGRPVAVGSGQVLLGRGVPKEADPALDLRMRPFRRLMGYGNEDGSLFLPISLEGHAFQAIERIGRALLASAEGRQAPGGWPGLMLDTPLAAADEVRRCKLAEVIVRLAQERQVVVTTRDSHEARLWQVIAGERDVPFAQVDLAGGRAVLASRWNPAPSMR